MGMKGCPWMLKWSGGIAYVCVELENLGTLQYTIVNRLCTAQSRLTEPLVYGPLKMYDERYVSQEVNEGIHGINFPASRISGLLVVKGCLRNTHVVKYRHMMITWKPPITKIEQALGRYVASLGKYVLGVIWEIYWIGWVG
ncbi:hypothetical protein PIB30_072297 [Stylosanthes scabra]|uniref:Uncharacterized protein n=1 Tax=Stylosanthes scabra TaxID=79078 RepID=A0ABU6UNZ3_9FABA|nr:hypothetical protein [Stylosanthes scabra]